MLGFAPSEMSQQIDEMSPPKNDLENDNSERHNIPIESVIQYAPSLGDVDQQNTFVDTLNSNVDSDETNSYEMDTVNPDNNSEFVSDTHNSKETFDSTTSSNKEDTEANCPQVFEVPLLDRHTLYPDYSECNQQENGDVEHTTENNDISADDLKVEVNSDSTVDYLYNMNGESFSDDIEENKAREEAANLSPSIHSFSPLPSTSRDYDIMNMNDMMFNEVNNGSPSQNDIKCNTGDSKVNVEKPNEDLNIVECSSGSDNADDEVVICSEIKPNIIDLSNEDAKYDSDCEIIDVDNIINENAKVLNVTQVSNLNSSIINHSTNNTNINDSVEIVSSNSESIPMPMRQNDSVVEVVSNNEQPQPSVPQIPDEYIPLYSELKSFFDSLSSGKLNIPNGTPDIHINHDMPNNYSSHSHPTFPYPRSDSHHSRRRSRRRSEHSSRKRRRIDSVIDLSVTSTIKPNSSSDVIVIDVDSPVNIQRSNNSTQISVSIMAPISQHVSPDPVLNSQHAPSNPVVNTQRMPSNPVVNPQDIVNPIVNMQYIPHTSIFQESLPANYVFEGTIHNVQPQAVNAPNVAEVQAPPEPVREVTRTPPRNPGDCPVCLENFSKVKAVSTLCGHLFCIGCITTVKRTSKKCPTCRKQLRGKGYHPVFL